MFPIKDTITQLFSGLAARSAQSVQLSAVAWWAFIGGFIFGLFLSRLFSVGRQTPRWYPDEYYSY